MKPSDSDPYNTPDAALEVEITDNKQMQSLPRLSILMVLALNILTLGLYYPYWLYTRSQIINRVQTHQIPSNLINTVLGLFLLSLVFSLMSGSQADNLDYKMASNLFTLIYSISTLFWAFTLRDRIHKISHASKQGGYWLSGLMIVLFQMLYLQYKINEYIDTHQSESSLAS